MATISGNVIYDKDKEKQQQDNQPQQLGGPQSSTIAPQAQQATSAKSGVIQNKAPSSGHFTNIQSYMGANKQAGSQLGQALGQNIQQQIGKSSQEATKTQQGLQGQIGQVGQQTQKIQDYSTNLGAGQAPVQPGEQGLRSNVVGPKYLASGYEANLGTRADYALQLANDPVALENFLKYRSGQVAQQEKAKLDEVKTKAEQATQFAQDMFKNQQEKLQYDRKALLSDLIKSSNYNTGKQSLDQAFLQLDKNNTLRNVRQDVKQQQQQFQASNQFPALAKQYGVAREGIDEATTGLQKQTEQNITDLIDDITSRKDVMNQARQDEEARLEEQFENLRTGKPIDPEFANALGLRAGQSLWNTLSNVTGLGSVADVTTLQQQAQALSDMANTRDVDLASAFAKLAQTTPGLTETSSLTGLGKVNPEFIKRLGEAQQAFEDAGSKRYNHYGLGWVDIDTSDLIQRAKDLGLSDADLQAIANDPYLTNVLYTGNRRNLTPEQYNAIKQLYQTTPGGYYDNEHLTDNGRFSAQASAFANAYKQIIKELAKQGYFNQVKFDTPAKPEPGKGYTPTEKELLKEIKKG